MPALADLKHQMTDLSLKAQAIVDDEARPLAERREEYDKLQPDIKALSDQIQDAVYLDEQRKSLSGLIGEGGQTTPDSGERTSVKSLGQEFTDSADFQAAMKSISAGGQTRTNPVELGLKATMLESGFGSANAVSPQYVPGIVPILFERLTVADLMPNTTTGSNLVRAVIESTATNAAATVAEGAAKPSSTINYTVVDEPVRKIANYLKLSNETLEDLPYVQGQVQGRLALFVRLTEETQLISGDGTGANLVGILNRSGLTAAQAKGADTMAVAVHKEITKIRIASFLEPDGIVMHPNDWQDASLETDANGQFYGNGPFSGPYGNSQPGNSTYSGSYWGLRAVVTQAVTEGVAVVGAFQLGGEVVRRSGLTVTMTNTDQDDFIKNLVTILAEERLALRVIRPAAFGTVTGL